VTVLDRVMVAVALATALWWAPKRVFLSAEEQAEDQ
jgi:hypothetical protein